MTTVTIYKSSYNYNGLRCKGHASYGKYGKDIVCASVSILVINTLNAMEELADEVFETKSDQETGYIECQFPNGLNDKSKLLMDAMLMGLKDIHKKYGKYFELIIREV